MTSRKKAVDFEQKLNQLESLVNDMEQGSLTLENSLKAFEEGIKITRECQQALKEAELRVDMLTRDSDSPTEFVPEKD
ncbi:exodeoxyribonuclease VII small subunit [Porticoccus litoralis]|uniref:Exodeoxyribonuclease 7 small subunit n=1 Tax=Porticoccus litoralis TaxID=434086 RepID=A0AAW8B0Q8_9GAMM|nr:exodeoxyribonuclease VII small subunit [Porticoccus litoralis]MDP1519993.1 exodeoxyribonuclease VII small subunit [Porticoccus litoralis]